MNLPINIFKFIKSFKLFGQSESVKPLVHVCHDRRVTEWCHLRNFAKTENKSSKHFIVLPCVKRTLDWLRNVKFLKYILFHPKNRYIFVANSGDIVTQGKHTTL